MSHYAVGRGHLALGEAVEAHERLKLAWELGDRSPELNFALGLSLAEIYRDAVEEAAAIRSGTRREAAIRWAERTYRDPAREYLERSRGGAEQPAFLAATLADVAGDREEPSPVSRNSKRTTRSSTREICSRVRSTVAPSRRRRAPATVK